MRCFNVICMRCLMAAVGTAGLLAPSRSEADNDVWKTAVSGTWSAGLNWVDSSSPSSIFDQATFNLPGAYTVSFNADPDPIGALSLTGAANVTFASSSRPPNPILPRSLSLVNSGALPGDLVLSNGSSLTLGAVTGGFPSTSHPFHLTAGGGIRVDSAATLNVKFGSVVTSSGNNNNILNGNVNVSAGSLIQNGNHTIGSNASVTITGAGSRLINTSLLEIGESFLTVSGGGALSITAGGQVECFDVTVGFLHSPEATVTVTGNGSLWKTTNNLLIGDTGRGTVNIQPGGTVSVGQETLVGQGRLRLQGGVFDTRELRFIVDGQFEWTSGVYHAGIHHADLVNQAGTLAPGHSAGSTTVLGNYTQQSAGILEIEIGGAAQGTQYDVVNVTLDAMLGGQLDLKLINGFVPTPSQSFIIMSADAVAGAFSNVANGQRLPAAGGGSFRVNYGPGSAFDPTLIVLSAFQSGLSGDFDVDGDVDGRDFLVWQRGGSPNPLSAGDLAVWRANFGSGGSTAASAAVPEPSTGTLAIIMAVGSRYRRRRTTTRVSTTH